MDIKENKKSETKQTLFLILGIFLISLFIIGGTYAYMTLGIDINNNVIAYNTTCFDIVYDADNDSTPITGTLIPSSGPGGGLNGKISLGLAAACKNLDAYGSFYLNVTSGSNVLFQIVDGHCENSQTLRTLTKYTDQESCEAQTNGKWVTNGTALKYAVYTTNNITTTTVPLNVGYINRIGTTIIYDNFPVVNQTVNYYVYVWLDGNLSDDTYALQSFAGNISASASQVQMAPATETYYVVYSETDNSLRFYDDLETITEGSTYNNLVATKVYTMADNAVYTYDSGTTRTTTPWDEKRDVVTKIVVEDEISPRSTANWFTLFTKVSSVDVEKLDTSRVTNMSAMFYQTGSDESATSFSIVGLDAWDVSNVVNFTSMFNSAGRNATTWNIGNLSNWNVSSASTLGWLFLYAGEYSTTWSVGDLSEWDVSNVTNMQSLFQYAGYNATTWSVGDLSGWDTSEVKNMSFMFYKAGYSAGTFNLGNLNSWDVSNVTNMQSLFDRAGYSATTWNIGDLSNWNVSNTTNMISLFNNVGYSATTWSVGDLSGWDTSNVTDMNVMFYRAGYSATTWSVGDLSGWDTSNVTDMQSLFNSAGYSATTWSVGDLSGWDTSNVTNMQSLFNSAGYSATTWSVGDLSGWDTSNVTNMDFMFYKAGYSAGTFDIGNLNNWDVSSVTTMVSLFDQTGHVATIFNIGDLSGWNTLNVTNMDYVFSYTGNSQNNWSLNLSGWNVNKVTSHTGFNVGRESKVTAPTWVS